MNLIDWCQKHGRLFGMTTEAERLSVRSWADHFTEAGYTVAELFAATAALTHDPDPPAHRTEHFAALSRVLQRIRRETGQAPPPDQGEPCQLCGDPATGWVSVPSLSLLNTRGEFAPGRPWATAVVTCKCALGLWLHRKLIDRKPTSLATYELVNPGWRDLVAAHEAELAREQAIHGHASYLDEVLGRLVQRSRPQTQED